MQQQLKAAINKELRASKKDVVPWQRVKPVTAGCKHFLPWLDTIMDLKKQGFNNTQIVNIFMRIKGENTPCSISKPWGKKSSTQYSRLTRNSAMVYLCHFCQEMGI